MPNSLFLVLGLKKLHDLLVLKITQPDEEKQKAPLVDIVRRVVKKLELEFPVDKGWIDIYVPAQKNIEHPYVIEVETGYDLNCSGILQKFERFSKSIPKKHKHEISIVGNGLIIGSSPIQPRLCVVIPKDFADFVPLFKTKQISVFLWEGTLEWECKGCKGITSGYTPWKPTQCSTSKCNRKERSFRLIDLKDLKVREAYRAP